MDVPVKRKVTAKLDYNAGSTYPRVQPPSRPGSPLKRPPASPLSPPPFRPKAKVNGTSTIRKLSSFSSLNAAKSNNVSPSSLSRPGSPFKSLRPITNGSPSPTNHVKALVSSRLPTKSPPRHAQVNQTTSESRQRSLTSASPNLKPPSPDDRPRSGSVGLYQVFPSPDTKTYSPQPSPISDRSLPDTDRANSPILPPTKIKSKVSGLAKAINISDAPPSPPSWVTTRPVNTRARAPSLTSSISLNPSTSSPPSNPIFYPITTAAPAANPHRFAAPRSVPPLARNHQTSAPTPDVLPSKKSPWVPKIDPASIPLPPHSPPISALSLSSKSSISQTSLSSNNDALDGTKSISTVGSHRRGHSVEWNGTLGTLSLAAPQLNHIFSNDRGAKPGHESDIEPGEESKLRSRAEAKTNRKIADLEITNRSLLAINASLETAKNRQAKEIRDLRRKLRESRLILPPPTFMALKSSFPCHDGNDDQDGDDDDNEDVEGAEDEGFERVRCLLDALIQTGQRALESTPEDFRDNSAKVLNADELRWWRDSGQHTASASDRVQDDRTTRGWLSPAHVAAPDGDSESFHNNDGYPPDPTITLPPPITITPS
ncbi:hypothetical protein J3A83DRAFT_3243873 [Scleroderma citrinum]